LKRDEEIQRLIRYAQGMGASVHFKPYNPNKGNLASWAIDGTEITIFVRKNSSKIEKILSLIHELSHHKAYINNDREISPELEDVLDKDDPNKKERHRIWRSEVRDSKYWETIYKDTNCQFDINKLYMQRELDLWIYEIYYETGVTPTGKVRREKMKELKKKYVK